MLNLNNELHKYNLIPLKYTKNSNIIIITTKEGVFVAKKNPNIKIYNYLKTRDFNYYPKLINSNDDEYELTEYIDNIDIPKEQKIQDLINVISILHKKTSHYKEIDIEDNKKIYEDITNNINYLYSYYNDIISIIESKVFMSPPEYLLARNISKVYEALNYCKHEIDNWYNKIKNKTKQRVVVIHNNLSLDHFLESDNFYLTSWNKAKIDSPIYDLYKLYKKYNLDYDFSELLKRYENTYPLIEEEKILLFILIALPDLIEFDKNNYNLCIDISNFIDSLYKTESLISPYYSKQTPQN